MAYQQNAEAAIQVTQWMRNMTDQLLDQSKIIWEGSLTTTRDAFEGVDQQRPKSAGGC
jgi:hypothetical protein